MKELCRFSLLTAPNRCYLPNVNPKSYYESYLSAWKVKINLTLSDFILQFVILVCLRNKGVQSSDIN
ncbi:hypothetical protein JHK82_054719 [Glycine max]|uniref:Uncharacterized protein n=2 Tax=Glycine subgen. Soja TaxID=1462606 RepID=K7N0D3_SOYBN|nr:hypothetical protein JHK86_054569 [Glycine max]RZB49770.1 hypothetical protein D0Y65_052606 [Glycine soja]KAG4929038.1 hypothetical protein JHK85_055524 [Glycine max]KAG5084551.1 hypothetical protein JHK84_054589 [Glycine max]KAG5087322.1 hypothetical protein JHK82_054719 [Glycine max]